MKTYSSQVKRNLKKSSKQYSTYVVTVGSALGSYWMQLGQAAQMNLLSYIPFIGAGLRDIAPLVGLVVFMLAFFLAKALPQSLEEKESE